MIGEIKSRPHYEVSFDTEEEARNEEYLLFDGWGPFVDTAVQGNTLYFADDINFGKGKSKIVAKTWWNGRATFVDV